MMRRTEFYDKQLEALRQKEMAEKMINFGDYAGARNKLLRAQEFYPLDHIVSMQTVCDILSASSYHIPGCELDYYRILSLVPSSTTQDIALQYRKLVTLMQPIKESFSGTELALKFLQDAFLVLSDNDKRAGFDLRRKTLWETYESPAVKALTFPNLTGNEVGTAAEVSLQCEKDASESLEKRNELNLSRAFHGMSTKEAVSCSFNNSSEGDVVEVVGLNSPINHPTILKGDQYSSSLNMAHKVLYQDFYNFDDDRNIDNMEEGQIWATHYQSNDQQNPRYAQIMTKSISLVTVMWLKPVPVCDQERRWCEAGIPVACGSFSLDLHKGEMLSSPKEFSYKCTWTPGATPEQFSVYPRKGEVWAIYEDWNLDKWSCNPEAIKSCKYKLVEVLSDFSRCTGSDCACLVKVQGFRSIFQRPTQEGIPISIHVSPSKLYSLSHKVPAIRLTGKEIDGVDSGMWEVDHLAVPNDMIKKSDDATKLQKETSVGKTHKVMMSKTANSGGSSFINLVEISSQANPCLGREVQGNAQLLNVIATGQIWAIYCGKDSLPRQYVLIDKVISRTQVLVTFLEPELTTELEINWKLKNLPITCGTFRAGGTTVSLETLQLSHLIKFGKTLSSYRIYPAKGEIWAMYQGWNSKWEVSNQENCQYWILEILSDFFEEEKIRVVRLKEVKGCLTFFHRLQSYGFSLISEISKTEILSFSHRILFYKVPGIQNHGIPESSYHLEPNDLPPKRSKLN